MPTCSGRCPTCPGKHLPIEGSGPLPSPHLFIGDRPNETDNRNQLVLSSANGQELDETYLPLSFLHRSDIRTTNAVKCAEDNNRTPSDKELHGCSRHFLPAEITRCQPDLIVLLGSSACKLTNGLIQVDMHHGIPQWVDDFVDSGWSGWVFPSYHPGMGMQDTSKMTYLLEDFETLGKYIGGSWQPLQPQYTEADLDYRWLSTLEDLYAVLPPATSLYACDVAVDTETHGPQLWSTQFSLQPGTGNLIPADAHELLRAFGDWVTRTKSTVILHNAPADLWPLTRMGIPVTRFRDTMQESYHLGNLPQGLKALAYRLLGVRMTSWEDTVRPASIDAAVTWLGEALLYSQAEFGAEDYKPYKKPKKDKLTGQLVYGKVTAKSHPITSAITRIIKHSVNPEYDIWAKMAEFWAGGDSGVAMWDYERGRVESTLGPMPILGIGNCTRKQAIRYACGDADNTLQVAWRLAEIRREVVQPGGRLWVNDADTVIRGMERGSMGRAV